jgi:dihydrofolate reductase
MWGGSVSGVRFPASRCLHQREPTTPAKGRTLEEPRWNNSTVLKGDVVSEVSKLKRELDGDIVVYASIQLVRALIEDDLADELRLMIFPVVLGAGERLFAETSDKKPLRLVHAGTVGGSLALLTYEVVRDA